MHDIYDETVLPNIKIIYFANLMVFFGVDIGDITIYENKENTTESEKRILKITKENLLN
jgi:hypothetical protein